MALLIVDVQDIYANNYPEDLVPRICAEAEKHDRVEMFFVGGFIAPAENRASVLSYWDDMGAPQNFLDRVRLHEKEYGYLSGWSNVPEDLVIKTLNYMHKNGLCDSRDIPKRDMGAILRLYSFSGWVMTPPEDPIFLPEFDYDAFKGVSWDSCGGSIYECLPEVETLLAGVGVQTRRIHELSWGD
jgi:hypothetical protein